jgi:hypothetical protein
VEVLEKLSQVVARWIPGELLTVVVAVEFQSKPPIREVVSLACSVVGTAPANVTDEADGITATLSPGQPRACWVIVPPSTVRFVPIAIELPKLEGVFCQPGPIAVYTNVGVDPDVCTSWV